MRSQRLRLEILRSSIQREDSHYSFRTGVRPENSIAPFALRTALRRRRLSNSGSGTRDEHLAALYAASLFAGFGLEPGTNTSRAEAEFKYAAHIYGHD